MNLKDSPGKYIPDKIASLEDYVPVETGASIKLDANESPYPLTDSLRAKLAELAGNLEYNRYPDPYAKELTAKFAQVYNVLPQRVAAGCGSDEILHLLCQTLIYEGASISTAIPDFAMYAFYAYLAGGKTISALRGPQGEIDFDKLMSIAAAGSCQCVMFSNPCNPTGAVTNRFDIIKFALAAPCPVVVDEAYGEFCSDEFSVLDLAGEIPNLIVLKTLSKAFGMAALRIGFAVASVDIIRAVFRVKSPYNLNAFSQAAGIAALEHADEVFTQAKRISKNTKAVHGALSALAAAGQFKATKPGANFILLKFIDHDLAKGLYEKLLQRGISLRLYDNALRVTCGTEIENEKFIYEFTDILKGSG